MIVPSVSGAEPKPKKSPPKPPLLEAGVFLIDKPAGPTSFQIVRQMRRALGLKKVGHAGTLDPFASGLLLVCAGRPATRIISRLMATCKEYEAILRLGISTDTLDVEGRITARRPVGGFGREQVEGVLACFRGELWQSPPQYSAVKHQGKPLYYYARQGVVIEKEPRRIMIFDLELLELEGDLLRLRVVCSKGTYVRSLAAEIGEALGCGAHLCGLRRLRSGPFSVQEALPGTALADPETAGDLLLQQVLTVEEALHTIAVRNEVTENSCRKRPEEAGFSQED